MKRRLLIKSMIFTVLLTGCLDRSQTTKKPIETNTVTIPGRWIFKPEIISIEKNTTVTWKNNANQKHTITFREDEPINFDTKLDPGEKTTYTFKKSGEFDYYCRYHRPDMTGKVIVKE